MSLPLDAMIVNAIGYHFRKAAALIFFAIACLALVSAGRAEEGELARELESLSVEGESLSRLERIAELYQAEGKLEEAAKFWHLASAREDATVETVSGLVRVYLAAGKMEGAAVIVKEAMARFPGSAELLYLQAGVHFAQDKLPAATYSLQRAVKLEPENPKYNYKLAELMFRRGNLERAEAILTPFLEGGDAMEDMELLNAQILFMTERERRGMRNLEKLLKRDPDNIRVKDALVALLLKHSMNEAEAGRVSRAVKVLEDADEIMPGERQILWGLALMEYEQGNGSQAIAYCQRVLESDPEDLETLLMYGRMQRKEGMADEAEATFRKGLAIAEEQGDRDSIADFNRALNPFE